MKKAGKKNRQPIIAIYVSDLNVDLRLVIDRLTDLGERLANVANRPVDSPSINDGSALRVYADELRSIALSATTVCAELQDGAGKLEALSSD